MHVAGKWGAQWLTDGREVPRETKVLAAAVGRLAAAMGRAHAAETCIMEAHGTILAGGHMQGDPCYTDQLDRALGRLLSCTLQHAKYADEIGAELRKLNMAYTPWAVMSEDTLPPAAQVTAAVRLARGGILVALENTRWRDE